MYNLCTVSLVSEYTRASSLIAWLQRYDLNSVLVSVSEEKFKVKSPISQEEVQEEEEEEEEERREERGTEGRRRKRK